MILRSLVIVATPYVSILCVANYYMHLLHSSYYMHLLHSSYYMHLLHSSLVSSLVHRPRSLYIYVYMSWCAIRMWPTLSKKSRFGYYTYHLVMRVDDAEFGCGSYTHYPLHFHVLDTILMTPYTSILCKLLHASPVRVTIETAGDASSWCTIRILYASLLCGYSITPTPASCTWHTITDSTQNATPPKST